MVRKSAQGPVQFLIETRTHEDKFLLHWTLDQRVSNIYDDKAWDRLYSQVQAHLNELSKRTGLRYGIQCWGTPEEVASYTVFHSVTVG